VTAALLPGEDVACWPAGAVALAAKGARIQVHDPRTGRERWLWDLICGYGAFNFGHAPASIATTLARAVKSLDGSNSLPSDSANRLAQRLTKLCGFARGAAYFTVGGSQAVEIALRIARILTGKPKVAVVASAFHGYGAQTLALSRDFAPGDVPDRDDVVYLPWNDERALSLLGEVTADTGALLIEPVLGAAGFRVPSPAWFRALLERARAAGMVTLVDEIQVGMGRTGRFLAVEHLIDTVADRRRLIDGVLLSKSLAGGLWPISAIVLNGARHPHLTDLNDTASLGETFSNNPAGCAAALAALDLVEPELLARVRAKGAQLVRSLVRRGAAARGLGFAIALDFPDKAAALAFVGRAWDQGVLCYVSGGKRFSCVKLIPALNLTDRELAAIEAALVRAL
jgi:acetylornithine/succinyldiaminopimelate/putrescine aminotransferase